ncbi:hypothetical protein ILUMI_00873 [Ignelater luminosus]|uniref:C-type lectin domain-containing protein n=1 Tax=Ignelater luminosus TaxID=2038154 RepID=A0A8K0DGF6_IGNLU|nr:hypothetical protein ILUMI_00873 [Ignelater luminosus]
MIALEFLRWMIIVNIFLLTNQVELGPPIMLSDKAELFHDSERNEDLLLNNTSVDWTQAEKSCKEHSNGSLLSIATPDDTDLDFLAEIISKADVGEIDTVWVDFKGRVCNGCGNEDYCTSFYAKNTIRKWGEGKITMIPCVAHRGFICKVKAG